MGCLDQNINVSTADMYTLAMASYAYVLAGHSRRDDMLDKLDELKIGKSVKFWGWKRSAQMLSARIRVLHLLCVTSPFFVHDGWGCSGTFHANCVIDHFRHSTPGGSKLVLVTQWIVMNNLVFMNTQAVCGHEIQRQFFFQDLIEIHSIRAFLKCLTMITV